MMVCVPLRGRNYHVVISVNVEPACEWNTGRLH